MRGRRVGEGEGGRERGGRERGEGDRDKETQRTERGGGVKLTLAV